jgi:type IV secretory pathway component VirB8
MSRIPQWLVAFACALASSFAAAQGQVNIICSVPIPWCEAVVAQFQKDTGIRASMTQKAAGEAMAQIKLINYDFARYGSAAERRRILEKWDRDVVSIPRS